MAPAVNHTQIVRFTKKPTLSNLPPRTMTVSEICHCPGALGNLPSEATMGGAI